LDFSFFLDEKRNKKIKATRKKAKNLLPGRKRNELACKIVKIEERDGLKQHFFSIAPPSNFLNAFFLKAGQFA
jgi:hypothetical protein